MYKKILFDLDNTLVDDDANRRYAFKQILLDRKEDVTKEKIDAFLAIDNQFWKDRAAGIIKDPYRFKNNEEKTRWVRAQRFLMYFKDITFEEAVIINEMYINYLNQYIVPIKNSKEILEYLYNKQYEIYIITNSPKSVVDNKLNRIDAKKYIKDTFSAEEAGFMKPNDIFFEKFFKKINSNKTDNMLIIGDELDKDILGGIKNGIDSCWFNINKLTNTSIFNPNYEINDLIELKSIL